MFQVGDIVYPLENPPQPKGYRDRWDPRAFHQLTGDPKPYTVYETGYWTGGLLMGESWIMLKERLPNQGKWHAGRFTLYKRPKPIDLFKKVK